ncbi:aldehyde dehydrogenase family protein [bacterium SCSIO 12741]|nr:aldehyde dehydrogenase family protein [bacterium SCSIO 12741]
MTETWAILSSKQLIDGKLITGESNETLTVTEKFSGHEMAKIQLTNSQQVEEAIQSSEKAFQEFSFWSAGERSEALEKLEQLLEQNEEEFARLICLEAGKPISYARTEVARCRDTLKTAAREALVFTGETVPMDYLNGTGKTAWTRRMPLGPVTAISPFNFPLNLAMHKIAPAIACGCTLVLKPAPQAPLSCLAFAKLVQESGVLPDGVLNVLVCSNEDAETLVRDERMKMLSFTGSSQVGWYLKSICGRKKTALELGGNAAVIVDQSADLEAAARQIAGGAYLYSGQICISTQRIFVHHEVVKSFTSLLVDQIEKVKSGDPMDETVINGPVIQDIHLDRIHQWVNEAVEQGAQVLTGGKILSQEQKIYAPTLLSQVNRSMKVCSEEVFGPVATLQTFTSMEEAIDEVNDSIYGLQAGVFTQNLNHLDLLHRNLDVGGIMINNVPGFRIDSMPYGGVKQSGLGREGVRYTMREMTEPRLMVL